MLTGWCAGDLKKKTHTPCLRLTQCFNSIHLVKSNSCLLLTVWEVVLIRHHAVLQGLRKHTLHHQHGLSGADQHTFLKAS